MKVSSLWAMFAMLNFRIVAALIAFEVFLVTVLFPGAGALLGLALGAVAGAAVFAVGRQVLANPETRVIDAGPAARLLLVSSAGAFGALFSFYLVLSGGVERWLAAGALVVSLAVLGAASVMMNRLTRVR